MGVETALMGGAALLGAVGSRRAAKSEKRALKEQAKTAEMNAGFSAERAHDALERGQWDQQQILRAATRLQGQQRAGYGASGVDVNYGTPLHVTEETRRLAEEDATMAATNAFREARGFEMQRANYLREAAAARKGAKSISPNTNFFTSLLGSAAKSGFSFGGGSSPVTTPGASTGGMSFGGTQYSALGTQPMFGGTPFGDYYSRGGY